MSRRDEITVSVKRKLSWLKNDGKCNMCNQEIGFFEGEKFIGEFAHIEDLKKATSRFNPNKSIEERNSEDNIILLCPTCHTKIDKYSEDYPTDILIAIKKEHEKNVEMSKEYANSELYAKFSDICNDLCKRCNEANIVERYISIEVEDKINKNSLNELSEQIQSFMRYIPIFKEYLSTMSQVERMELRRNILGLYLHEQKKDISNVEKFTNLIKRIVGCNLCNAFQAGIIICNYFEECDVFEV